MLSGDDHAAVVLKWSSFIRGRLKAWAVKDPQPALLNGLLDTCVNYHDEHGEFPPSS